VSDFLDRLRRGPCLLLDGGLGSELIARGLAPGTPPDLWTLERPEELTAVHRSYVQAGSDAIHANTFGSNAARLEQFGLLDRIEEINRTAVRLARESGATYVIANIGPTGEYLPPVGHGDLARWRRHFVQQAEILATTPIDAFHVETMTDVREALTALDALLEVAPSIPVLISMAFESKKKGFFTIMGDPLGPSLARLWAAGPAAVGANCGMASPQMRALAREVLSSPGGAASGAASGEGGAASGAAGNAPGSPDGALLVFQPNAGKPQMTGEGIRYAQDPAEFAEDLASLLSFPRVAALGGCCGTDPRFIAALRARLP